MTELDLDAIQARAAQANVGRSTPSQELVRLQDTHGLLVSVWRREFVDHARGDIAALVARVRELEARDDTLVGDLNTIVESCWPTGIKADFDKDQQPADYPVRVLNTLATRVRELEEQNQKLRDKLAFIRGAMLTPREFAALKAIEDPS